MSVLSIRAPLAAALAYALLPSPASAGAFLLDPGRPTDSVMHMKGYPTGVNPVGGNYIITVCLNPNTTPLAAEQPVKNAVAEFNRLQGVNGNVTAGPGGGARDFESVMLHEMGHCMGLDHNTLGPSELNSGDFNNVQLYYTNARQALLGYQTDDGVDNVRGSRDDIRGDDQNVHWFRTGVNDPFGVPPATVDQTTFTVNTANLPLGHLYPEAATSHAPCAPGAAASTSSLPGRVANTQSIMMPVLCSNNSIRKLARDDSNQLRIARAGYNGTAGNQDDYTWTMQYIGRVANCDLPISLVSDGETGFAQCNVGYSLPGNGANDTVLTSMTLIARASVNWFYNPVDTTAAPAGRIFYSGFE